jgi:hypothetical protein
MWRDDVVQFLVYDLLQCRQVKHKEKGRRARNTVNRKVVRVLEGHEERHYSCFPPSAVRLSRESISCYIG